MSGIRLVVGVIVMGIAVPVTVFLLLGLTRISQLLTIAAVTFISWGLGDILARILEKPRLENRSPGQAIREGLDRQTKE